MGIFDRPRKAESEQALPPDDPLDEVDDFAGPDAAELFCRRDNVSFPLGNEETLVYVRDSQSAHVLPTFIADLQNHCDTFRTMPEHAIELCRRYGMSHHEAGALEEHLERLADEGLLTSKAALLEDCHGAAAASSDTPPAISSVVTTTCDRVDAALRCVKDFIDAGKRFDRSITHVVLDDSRGADVRREYRERLRSTARDAAVTILYAGREEKEQFMQALTSAVGTPGLPAHVVEFALFGSEGLKHLCGANHNAALLQTAGSPLLATDDDVFARIAPAPEMEDTIAVVSTGDPTDLWFFADRESALDAVEFTDEDLLAQHERLLGRLPASCVADLSDAQTLDLDEADSRLLTLLVSGGGKVLATSCGIVGDCGMGAPSYYLTVGGESSQRLLWSDPGYEVLRTTREVVRAVPRWTIGDTLLLQGTSVGLDNTNLLPPYFPVQRNTDGIFAATLRSCCEGGLLGYLPWVVTHDPPSPRAFDARELCTRPCEVHTPDVILQCVMSHVYGQGTMEPADRMRALGRQLQDLGTMEPGGFEEFLRMQRWHRVSSWISRLEESLRTTDDAPEAWTEDVERCIDEARASLLREDDVVPIDLIAEGDVDRARTVMQRLVFRFGELLEYWPDIHDAARRLREDGQTLARAVGA
jgi:hypothetical protein